MDLLDAALQNTEVSGWKPLLTFGFFAGVVATVGAEVTVALLQSQVFELGAEVHWWIWPVGPASGALVISAVGMFGSRELVNSPPVNVLRGVS